MNILIACEESQECCKAFREQGHNAFSCDILPCSGGHPEWHLQDDVRHILNYEWDMIIAFPPCTHLAVSGAKHFERKRKEGTQSAAIDFFMLLANQPCKRIAIENPIGIMSTWWRKPDQIIQPWQFGHSVNKTTCLWLKGLPPLIPTKIVSKADSVLFDSGKRMSKWYYETSCLPHKQRSIARSRTFPGIAMAMAQQWAPSDLIQ